MIKIDKNVPIPGPVSQSRGISLRGAPRKYPRGLGVGDSFFVPTSPDDHSKISNALRTWCRWRHKEDAGHYCTRTVIENDVKGIRVWRLM